MTKPTKYALAISLTLFVVLIMLVWALKTPWAEKTPLGIPSETTSPTSEAYEPTIDDLLDAIEQVESGGDANAVGDGGEAVGAYQLHRIYVDDINRILGKNKYTYDDRWDREKSREMTRIYLEYYTNLSVQLSVANQKSWDICYGNNVWLESAARIHNGGPDGWKKESTKPYWEKVQALLTYQ